MVLIQPGTELGLTVLILCCAFPLISMYLSTQGIIKPKIRRIPALDAVDEGVGRAAEMGRPLHFTTGGMPLTRGTLGGFPAIMAGVAVLSHVAELCAEQGVPLIDTVGKADKYALEFETVREAYLRSSYPESFNPDNIRYASDTQYAFGSAIVDTLNTEQCATNIMIGGYGGENTLIAEAGFSAGCFQVGGNPRYVQIAFFVVICDYTLIGEEVFVAGALLRKEPEEIGSIFGQDLMRYVTLAITIIGAFLAFAGSSWLYEIL